MSIRALAEMGYANTCRLAGGHDASVDYDVAAKAMDSL